MEIIKIVIEKTIALRKSAPVLCISLILWLIVETFVIFIAPFFVPDSFYLSLYLGKEAMEQTNLFLNKEDILLPDNNVGWVNKPNVKIRNWKINEIGARSKEKIQNETIKEHRVVFLGSSLTNGNTHITNEETISAYLENEQIESINFGTMMYSIDQSLLLYLNKVKKYNPDTLIVEIETGVLNGIKNNYIPFMIRSEKNLQFLKNRFVIRKGIITLTDLDIIKELSSIPNNKNLLKFLSENDNFYYNYNNFKRFGFTPIGGFFNWTFKKINTFKKDFIYDQEGELILNHIMKYFTDEAGNNGTKVMFLYLPNRSALEQKWKYKYLPDKYGLNLEKAKNKGYITIDVREVLISSKKNPSELYAEDQNHYTPLANKIIAEHIRRLLIL